MQHTTMKKISPTPKVEREYKDIDYDRFKYLPLTEEAIEFINYVIKVFKDEDLDNFYNNINEVGIFLHSKFGNGRNYYSITTNDIYI